jgi:hypothetical protein
MLKGLDTDYGFRSDLPVVIVGTGITTTILFVTVFSRLEYNKYYESLTWLLSDK